MPLWKEYFTPTSVTEALSIRSRYGQDALFVAGGTDLVLDMQQGNHPPVAALVDVTTIGALHQISEEHDFIVLGAAVTHAEIESNPLVQQHGTALAESCGVVGGPQVRNVATIGGNVAHALPAADGTIGLLALHAEVQVSTLDRKAVRAVWKPLLSIFAGPGKNNLADNQMVTAFRFHKRHLGQGSAFDRIMRPQGVALPILGAAANLILADNGTRVSTAFLAIGPAGPIPFRATDAEQILKAASQIDDTTIEQAVAAAQAQAELRTSKHRASKEYRHEMVAVLLHRILSRSIARAQRDF